MQSHCERTLIIVEENSFVKYLEGCSDPLSKINQLHCAIVEIIAMKKAISQNKICIFGDAQENGGALNFVTQRASCKEENSEVNW